MKMQRLKYKYQTIVLGCLFGFMLVQNAFSQSPEQFFEAGNSEYAKNNFEAAIVNYENVLESGYSSAAVYYNLGNANYKLNRIAPSVYNYEKALLLKPNDAEIKNNLQFAQNMTIDAITPLPQNTFKKWYNQILGIFTIDGWATATIVLVFLFTLSFVLYFFNKGVGSKRIFFTVALVSIFLALLSLTLTFQAKSNEANREYAIVFSVETELKSEPNNSSEQILVLHEGTKVRVLEEQDDWRLVRLADGKEGWLPKVEIKIL